MHRRKAASGFGTIGVHSSSNTVSPFAFGLLAECPTLARYLLAFTVVGLAFAPAAAQPDPLEQGAIEAATKLKGKAAIDVKLEETARVAVMLEAATDDALLALCKQPSIGGRDSETR